MAFVTFLMVLIICDCTFANQEEDLIESVTQLEQFAKEVRQEMIGLRINVEQKLSKFKQKEFDWLHDYFGLKKTIPTKEDVLKEAQSKVDNLIQNLKNENRDVRLKVHKYKMVHGSKGITKLNKGLWKSKDVSFRSNDPLKRKLDAGENIILTNVLENNGNAYDNYTGVFIAPVTGTYFFVLQLCCGHTDLDLAVSTETIYNWARFFANYACQSLDMLIPLERGDKVFAFKSASRDYDIMSDGYELDNTFSGVLLA